MIAQQPLVSCAFFYCGTDYTLIWLVILGMFALTIPVGFIGALVLEWMMERVWPVPVPPPDPTETEP